MKHSESRSRPTLRYISDEDLAEIERSTVLLAEITAGALRLSTEAVLTLASDEAAGTGSTPFEVLRRMRNGRKSR
jgi:hypothetical protein